MFSGSLGQNTSRFLYFLAQFLFTTSETGLDFYDRKVNVRIALRVSEQFPPPPAGGASVPTQEKKKT